MGFNSISSVLFSTLIAVMNILNSTLILFLPFKQGDRKSSSLQPSTSDKPAKRQDQLFFPAINLFAAVQQTIKCSNIFISYQ